MGHVLDYLRAFGTKIDQWIIAPRDEDEWYDRRGGILDKLDRDREIKRCSRLYCKIPDCDGKDQIQGSPKQTYSCWFARYCYL